MVVTSEQGGGAGLVHGTRRTIPSAVGNSSVVGKTEATRSVNRTPNEAGAPPSADKGRAHEGGTDANNGGDSQDLGAVGQPASPKTNTVQVDNSEGIRDLLCKRVPEPRHRGRGGSGACVFLNNNNPIRIRQTKSSVQDGRQE